MSDTEVRPFLALCDICGGTKQFANPLAAVLWEKHHPHDAEEG